MTDGSTSQFAEIYLVNEKMDLVTLNHLFTARKLQQKVYEFLVSIMYNYKNKFNLEYCAPIWSPYFA